MESYDRATTESDSLENVEVKLNMDSYLEKAHEEQFVETDVEESFNKVAEHEADPQRRQDQLTKSLPSTVSLSLTRGSVTRVPAASTVEEIVPRRKEFTTASAPNETFLEPCEPMRTLTKEQRRGNFFSNFFFVRFDRSSASRCRYRS